MQWKDTHSVLPNTSFLYHKLQIDMTISRILVVNIEQRKKGNQIGDFKNI